MGNQKNADSGADHTQKQGEAVALFIGEDAEQGLGYAIAELPDRKHKADRNKGKPRMFHDGGKHDAEVIADAAADHIDEAGGENNEKGIKCEFLG